MKNTSRSLLFLFSSGLLTTLVAAPPQANDLGYRVYLLEKQVDEHGQRLEVVDRRTKAQAFLRSTDAPFAKEQGNQSKQTQAPVTPIETRYEVKTGDSLWSIARKFKVPVDHLKETNGLKGSKLHCGKILLIPASIEVPGMPQIIPREATTARTKSPEPIKTTRNTVTAKTAARYHSVDKGDTLNGIARQYATTIDQLQDLNNISNIDSIQIGQRLLIPTSPEEPPASRRPAVSGHPPVTILPTRQPSSLANRSIIQRPLESRLTGRRAIPVRKKSSTTSAPSLISYTIKQHETLESIAELFATTVVQLREINRFDGKEGPLQGTTILVPTAGIFLDLHS